MPTLYLDIETIPSAREDLQALAIKKAAKKVDGRQLTPEETDKAIRDMAVDGALCEIVTIGAAIDDREPKTWARALDQSESDLLRAFRDDVSKIPGQTRIVGHNLLRFDRNVIRQRGLVHSLRMPALFTMEVKPWEKDVVVDTMTLWCGDIAGRVSLDVLCASLGLPGKEGFDGSQVWDAMKRGEHERVAAYCADDVRKTRAVFKRLTEGLS